MHSNSGHKKGVYDCEMESERKLAFLNVLVPTCTVGQHFGSLGVQKPTGMDRCLQSPSPTTCVTRQFEGVNRIYLSNQKLTLFQDLFDEQYVQSELAHIYWVLHKMVSILAKETNGGLRENFMRPSRYISVPYTLYSSCLSPPSTNLVT